MLIWNVIALADQQDEKLLALVETYGRNWKFIAQNHFYSRAPLALKNRNSLLIRRLHRQALEDVQQEQDSLQDFDRFLKTSRHGSLSSITFSGSSNAVSPLSPAASPASSLGFLTRAQGPLDEPGSLGLGMGHLPFWNGTQSTEECIPLVTNLIDQGRGGDILPCAIPPGMLGDQDFHRSQYIVLAAEGGISHENEGPMTDSRLSLTTSSSERQMQEQSQSVEIDQTSPRVNPSGAMFVASGVDTNAPAAVEYSMTCRRGKLKAVVAHLVDAGISEIGERAAEDDYVTIKLQFVV